MWLEQELRKHEESLPVGGALMCGLPLTEARSLYDQLLQESWKIGPTWSLHYLFHRELEKTNGEPLKDRVEKACKAFGLWPAPRIKLMILEREKRFWMARMMEMVSFSDEIEIDVSDFPVALRSPKLPAGWYLNGDLLSREEPGSISDAEAKRIVSAVTGVTERTTGEWLNAIRVGLGCERLIEFPQSSGIRISLG